MRPMVMYVAHPVSGDVEANLARARRWLRYLVDRYPDHAFSMPWVAYVEALDDANGVHRKRGLRDDLEMVRRCDGIVAVGDRVSAGMQEEIDAATEAGLAVRYILTVNGEPSNEAPFPVAWPSPPGRPVPDDSTRPTALADLDARRIAELEEENQHLRRALEEPDEGDPPAHADEEIEAQFDEAMVAWKKAGADEEREACAAISEPRHGPAPDGCLRFCVSCAIRRQVRDEILARGEL